MVKPKGFYPILILALLIAAGAAVWWFYLRPAPLVGFASGNGRIEATEVDIATKFYGRISEIYVDEGDRVGERLRFVEIRVVRAALMRCASGPYRETRAPAI